MGPLSKVVQILLGVHSPDEVLTPPLEGGDLEVSVPDT